MEFLKVCFPYLICIALDKTGTDRNRSHFVSINLFSSTYFGAKAQWALCQAITGPQGDKQSFAQFRVPSQLK